MKSLKITLGLFVSLSLAACGGGSTPQPSNPQTPDPTREEVRITGPDSLELEQGSDVSLSISVTGNNSNLPYEVNVIFPADSGLSVVSIVPRSSGQYVITLRAAAQMPIGISDGVLTVKIGTSIKNIPLSVKVKTKSAGSYYSSFGQNGLALSILPVGAEINSATDVAVDSQGRMLLLGYTQLSRNTDIAFTVTRFLSNGKIDSTFGINGSTVVNPSDNAEQAHKIYVTPNGKILILGLFKDSYGVMRLLENGDVDTSYGSQGTMPISNFDVPSSSSVQTSDGKVLIAIHYMVSNNFFITRLNADGTLDSTFAADSFKIESNVFQTAFQIQSFSNGDAIFAANEYQSDRNILLKKFKYNGEVDQSFGLGGEISVDLGSSDDILNSLAVDSQDHILLFGRTKNLNPVLVKFAMSGNRITSFGKSGQITFTEDKDVSLDAAISNDDNIVLYDAYTTLDSVAVKVNPDGNLDRFVFSRPIRIENNKTGLNRIIWSQKLNRYIGYGDLTSLSSDDNTSKGILYTFAP